MKNYPTNKLKILNDPIYGFIRIPNSLIFDIIEHPSFQRLRRVSQMGFSNLVYPGANHTRFHHALGCLHLMQKTVNVLRVKGIDISEDEENALYIAILLHDIGHGAFSHALEHSIVTGITHEEISLKYMHQLNKEFDGQLDLAISVFNGEYHRKFLHQLITSQLDIDRLDYLKRDSFYTGVAEGNISSDRLIAMINVVDNELVIEKKGIYSVEKFLIARRLMYWQVYLHKTVLSAEFLLAKILERAREILLSGSKLFVVPSLKILLSQKITSDNISQIDFLKSFSKVDDYDVFTCVKIWCDSQDKIISSLSKMMIERNLPKVKISAQKFSLEEVENCKSVHQKNLGFNNEEMNYFVYQKEMENNAYDPRKDEIKILFNDGSLKDITQASDNLNISALAKPVKKYYLFAPYF